MNNVHFSSQSDEWSTPQHIYNYYDRIFEFDIDLCATKENAKCNKFYTIEDNALTKEWDGISWCNPPYSNIAKFIEKAYNESKKHNSIIVMLIPARPDTKAWAKYIVNYAQIDFITGRLKFGNSNNSAPFPSAVVIFGLGHTIRWIDNKDIINKYNKE